MKIPAFLKKSVFACQRGVSLMEAAVAVLLLGGCVVVLVMGVSSGAMGVHADSREVTAQGLARTQMEMIKNSAFDATGASYPAVTTPAGYSVAVSVAPVQDAGPDIQKVTASVSNGGETLLSLQDYKVNR